MTTRVLVATMALLASVTACRDQELPTAAPRALRPHKSIILSSAPSTWTQYWRNDSTLWVYDQILEAGMISQGRNNDSNQEGTKEVQAIHNLGMRLVAMPLYWNEWVGDAGTHADWDSKINSAVSLGMEPVMVVVNDGNCDGSNDPCINNQDWPYGASTIYTHFGDFLVSFASTHPSVHFYILWNEPDGGWWSQTMFYNYSICSNGNQQAFSDRYYEGRAYADMLRSVYPRLKAVQPDSIWVLAAGLTGTEHFTSDCKATTTEASWTFLNGMYDNGGAPYFDFLALHAYGSNAWDNNGIGGFNLASQLLRQAVDARDPKRPIWMTEYGMNASNAAQGGSTIQGMDQATMQAYFDQTQHDYYDLSWHSFVWNGVLTKMIGYTLVNGEGGSVYDANGNQLFGNSPGDNPDHYGFGIMYPDASGNLVGRPAYNLLHDLSWQWVIPDTIDRYNGGRTAPVRIQGWSRCMMVPRDYPSYLDSDGSLVIQNVTVRTLAPTKIVFQQGPSCVSQSTYWATIQGPQGVQGGLSNCTWTVSTNVNAVHYYWTLNGNVVGSDSPTLSITSPSSAFTLGVQAWDGGGAGASGSLSVDVSNDYGPYSCYAQ